MDKNKVKGFVTGVLCTALVGTGIFGGRYVLSNKDHAVNQESVQKAKAIESLIDKYYLDEIDNDELESYLYKGLMAGLGDPYSTYYTAEEYKELTEDTEGVYRGIGVTMQKDVSTGAVTVVKCFEGAPGAEAGLQPQDQLVKVNGEDITDKELSEVVKMIKTSKSDTVTLTILREGESDYREVEVTLDTVEAPMVEHEMLDDKLNCYINASKVPVIEEAHRHADEFLLTAAGQRNRNHTGPFVEFRKIPFSMEEILFDPQTSGGLLVAVKAEQAEALEAELQNAGLPAKIVGTLLEKNANEAEIIVE